MHSPYKRIKEIDERLKFFEAVEQKYASKNFKYEPKELKNAKEEIMFLCFEKIPIEKTIKWLEAKKLKQIQELKRKTYWVNGHEQLCDEIDQVFANQKESEVKNGKYWKY